MMEKRQKKLAGDFLTLENLETKAKILTDLKKKQAKPEGNFENRDQ